LPESTVYADEYSAYERLNRDGYRHSRVDPAEEIYIAGNFHTNAIDEDCRDIWTSTLSGINHQEDEQTMFLTMLCRISSSVG
jgi:hypothetical protein